MRATGNTPEGAETRRERALLVVVEVLVAEEQHLMLDERVVDRRELVVGERRAQIDARNHRAERRAHAVDGDRARPR